ncbi:MAG: restriction endonuclease subunit S [Gallionella sp.]|nr:restriction endonuclease subunit S [Gallionella sp.]
MKDSNFTPDDFTAYKYIELADIDNSGGISGCTEALGNELPSRARRIVDAGDVLISSIEGSLSSCAIVPGIMGTAALCSTGFYAINSDKINSETLLVLFKSPLLQNLLKQGCSGTILTAINKTEFQNIPVPIIEGGEQTKIAALVKESFSLKAESERLLDVAKRAVEIAIEQDENAALDWLFRMAPDESIQ